MLPFEASKNPPITEIRLPKDDAWFRYLQVLLKHTRRS